MKNLKKIIIILETFTTNKKEKNYLDLFTLTFFSFSNLIRFNNKKEFNMPYGHRCFLSREHDANIYLAHNVFNSKKHSNDK